MAGRPTEAGTGAEELVGVHGAGLHRLAVMLTGDQAAATRLTGLTLAHAPGAPTAQDLRQRLVRTFVRTAPRRRERTLPTATRDAGDVVARLAPRARAAAVLRLVEGASVADIATTLRIAPDRVGRLVPDQEGVGVALEALAHRHALTGDQLQQELGDAVAQAPPEPPDRDRRWWWAAAAAVPLAVLGGYALSLDREDRTGPDDAAAPSTSVSAGAVDLTDAGFELRDDGTPPGGAAGLRLQESVVLAAGDEVDVELGGDQALFATFAVLWCDMPPAQDRNLETPAGMVTVAGERIPLPCAGRDGEPAVTEDHLVTLPPGGLATVAVTGDLPPDGEAALGVYAEDPEVFQTPFPKGDRTDAPAVPADSTVVETEAAVPFRMAPYTRRVQAVELGADTTIRVWAGRTGAVSVTVDGSPVTDDGDLAAWADGEADWREQDPGLRDGRWTVYAPGQEREFPLPPEALPAPGERREAVVEVMAEGNGDHVQVVATDTSPVDVDLSPAARTEPPDLPTLVSGHRLVGTWELPADAHARELESPPADPSALVWSLLLEEAPESASRWAPFAGEGLLQRGEEAIPVYTMLDPSQVVEGLAAPWADPFPLDDADAPLRATAPATPGHPTSLLVGYEPVPYEEFDFAAAAVPEHVWRAGEDPGRSDYGLRGDPLETLRPADLDEDGTTVLEVPAGGFGARISTEGKGRIRFLVDDHPVDGLHGTGGWWSSWTVEAVTSETPLSYSYGGTIQPQLTVVVEDYEDFTIELLRM